MSDVRGWLRNAFAVDETDGQSMTDAQREVADKVCSEVVRRGMTTPGLMAL